MANVTLAIEDEVLRKARMRALEQGTSVNAVIRSFLESYAGTGQAEALRGLLDLAADVSASGEAQGVRRAWKREEIYEDRARWPRS